MKGILVAGILAIAAAGQTTTVTITVPAKSAPAIYSFAADAFGGVIVKQVTLDNSVTLGTDNDVVFARATPPRSFAYWLQAIKPSGTIFGPTRDLWCVPGAANARPVATFQQVNWLQGDDGTNSYLALLSIVAPPAPALLLPTNVIDTSSYAWIPSDSNCEGQPSITFFDLTRNRFSVYVFVLTI